MQSNGHIEKGTDPLTPGLSVPLVDAGALMKPTFDVESARGKVIECSRLLPREYAEKYSAIVLDAPFGSFRCHVGILKDLNPDEKRSLSRILNTFSTSAIKFTKLDPMIFDILLREAYAERNLTLHETKRNQQQTREKRDFDGGEEVAAVDNPGAGAAAKKEPVSFEELAGKRLDLTDLEEYYLIVEKLDAGTLKESELETSAHVKFILQDFALSGGSDIHFHSSRGGGAVRYRYQGEVYTRFANIPLNRFKQIVNSLCILASRDPSRMKREPVESVVKLRIRLDGVIKDVEFRFESLPTLHSPSANLRGQTKPIRDIRKIGFNEEQLEQIRQAASSSRGIVIVTGPTGSGKTNTLNAMFAPLEDAGDKVIIELGNPIEIESDLRVQLPVAEMASEKGTDIIYQLLFKACLRFDPDVIAFTEIRNSDEVKIAFRAANTGHLVFTTMHAADVEETLGLLFDFGLSRNIIAKGILAVVAQTLIQKLCEVCKKEDPAATEMAGGDTIYVENGFDQSGKPCMHCENGFSGRTAVAEVLLFNDEVRNSIVFGAKPSEIVQNAAANGYFTPMKRIALEKVLCGVTTEGEVEQLVDLRPELNADVHEMIVEENVFEFPGRETEVIEAEYEDVEVNA